jgi:hypothetical protein
LVVLQDRTGRTKNHLLEPTEPDGQRQAKTITKHERAFQKIGSETEMLHMDNFTLWIDTDVPAMSRNMPQTPWMMNTEPPRTIPGALPPHSPMHMNSPTGMNNLCHLLSPGSAGGVHPIPLLHQCSASHVVLPPPEPSRRPNPNRAEAFSASCRRGALEDIGPYIGLLPHHAAIVRDDWAGLHDTMQRYDDMGYRSGWMIQAFTEDGLTPLILATDLRDPDYVQCCVDRYGADTNQTTTGVSYLIAETGLLVV